MKKTAYYLLLGAVSSSEESINFSYMKKKELAATTNTDEYSILSTVSNWFTGDKDGGDELETQYKKRSLQVNSQYQVIDYNYGVLADYQYQTYYNYNYGDLYDTRSGGVYNYNYNIYTYTSTTNTQSVTYTTSYKPPSYSKIYIPPKYSKVPTPVYKTTYKATTTYTNSTKKEAPKKTNDGGDCKSSSECKSWCCEKNIAVMPGEGVQDLYGLRVKYYDKNYKTYTPPGGKAYSYSDK